MLAGGYSGDVVERIVDFMVLVEDDPLLDVFVAVVSFVCVALLLFENLSPTMVPLVLRLLVTSPRIVEGTEVDFILIP
jgi:hypothetical protein